MIELIFAILLQLLTTTEKGQTKDKNAKDSDVATTQSFSTESTSTPSSTEGTNTTQYGGTGTWDPK